MRPGAGARGGEGGISAENISGETVAAGVACGPAALWEQLNAGALGSIPPETTGALLAVLRELLRGAGALLWGWAELSKKNRKAGAEPT